MSMLKAKIVPHLIDMAMLEHTSKSYLKNFGLLFSIQTCKHGLGSYMGPSYNPVTITHLALLCPTHIILRCNISPEVNKNFLLGF